jgi:hypothetical protein
LENKNKSAVGGTFTGRHYLPPQAPPSAAFSFYLTQDAATMKCQIVETQPAAGGSIKVVGAAHSTRASAETALTADKTCKQ